MALTNFSKLTTNQLTVWSRDLWRAARNVSFLNAFVGSGPDAMVQRITELKKGNKGARAVITLVQDLQGDGVVGDNTLEGNEEAMSSADQIINIDQIRHANRLEGRMADQRSVVEFRNNSKNVLQYWLADRLDQLGFLTLSGVAYSQTPNGATRVGSQFPQLDFAADVSVPTANRHFRWNAATGTLAAADTSSIAATDTPSWKMLVQMKAKAVSTYMKPIRTEGGVQVYNVFLSPQGMAALKQDSDFMEVWKLAQQRGNSNPLFKGTPLGGVNGFYLDGLNIMEFRHVYNTTGAASGSKWGSSGTVDGQRILLCGAQALGFADIGLPIWVEKDFDYDNSPGISAAKIIGFKKPVFPSIYTGTTEDFGVMCIDTAIQA